jgi:hypothetical protein
MCFRFRDLHAGKPGRAENHYSRIEGWVSQMPHVQGQPDSAVRRAALEFMKRTIFGHPTGVCFFCRR